jgi:hypothetical protein
MTERITMAKMEMTMLLRQYQRWLLLGINEVMERWGDY